MKWKKISSDMAVSDCHNYYVRLLRVFGDKLYEALYKPSGQRLPVFIGPIVLHADAAQRHCEEHRKKMTSRPIVM